MLRAVALILSLAANSYGYSCPAVNQVCQNTVGATCAYSNTTIYTCNYPMVCNGTSNQCQTSGLNYACDGYTSCADGFTCLPNSAAQYVCTAQYSGPGQSCSQNGDCGFFNYTSAGVTANSTCVSGKCFALAAGATCQFPGQCTNGYFCSSTTFTCIQQYPLGHTCSDSSQCASFYGCAQTSASGSKTCVQAFSGASGSPCMDDIQCGDGLYCNTSVGTCGVIAASSLRSCNQNSDCSATEFCGCQGLSASTSVCIASDINWPSGTSAAYVAYETCMQANPICTLGSCSACSSQICSLNKLDSSTNPGTCGLSPADAAAVMACYKTNTAASVTVSIVGFAAIAFVLSIL